VYVLVFANGELDDAASCLVNAAVPDLVVCADGGVRHARALGLVPDFVIGDLDSLPNAHRQELTSAGVEFVSFPTAKDETDLELALLHAADRGADKIMVLGARGGRLDHELGNLMLLAHPRLLGVGVSICSGNQVLTLVRHQASFHGCPGDLLSLLPIGGDALGVRTVGLEYPLNGEALLMGPGRGVSNVFVSNWARVSLDSGMLFAVHTRQGDN
jgi:thiamine pyrophosphokinase